MAMADRTAEIAAHRPGCRKLASGPSCRVVPASGRRRSRLRTSTGLFCGRRRARASNAVVARYYDPQTAQFLTRDPLEDITGQPYAYADDDPIDNSDPTGLSCGLSLSGLGDCVSDVVGFESGYDTVQSFSNCLDSNSAYDCAVMNFDPAYAAIQGYSNEVQASEDGCSLGTIAEDGLEGVLGVAGTAGLAVAAAGPVADGLASVDWMDETGALNPGEPTVSEVLQGKMGSIKNAPLPPGSPSWNDIGDMTLSQIRAAARSGQPGYKTILKLLTDSRFNR